MLDEPSPFRTLAVESFDAAGVSWLAYIASTLSAVRAAVKAGMGITLRPVEMMSPELRVLGASDGLPELPATRYALCKNPQGENELAMAIFNAMQSGSDTYTPKPPSSLEGEGQSPSLEDE